MASPDTLVWFITGRSTGFGRDLAPLVITRGWHAVVTARDAVHVADRVKDAWDRALALALDVTDAAAIAAATEAAETQLGRIDGLVNNAGYR